MICIDTHAFEIIIFCKKKVGYLNQGGGGYSLYKLYRYVPPHQVGFLHCSGLRTGIYVAHFGESGMVFEGTMGVYEHSYRFNSRLVKKKEKYANSKWI